MASNKLTMDIRGVPEVVWGLMHRLAQMLREEADSESDPRVAKKLAAIADRFEAGQ